MRTFATDTEFTGAISTTLHTAVSSDDIRRALVAGIGAGEHESRQGPSREDGGMNLRLNNWVLRDQDVPMTELIGVVGAAAAAMLTPGGIVAAAVVTTLSSFAALVWKAWRKGAKLTKAEVATIGFLEVQGPMSDEDLLAKAPAALPGMSAVDVQRAIQTLQDVELRDGNIVSLIRRDASGLWRTTGV